jgi:dTDP-4-dehydrorhamnose 3,5-epimerase
VEVIALDIPGVLIIKPHVFKDHRGLFYESYNLKSLHEVLGTTPIFNQENHSQSCRGVLRGLHFQRSPYAQGKLVQVISGTIFDVAVDIRQGSPTYAKWTSYFLKGDEPHLKWIPPGFAHGFLVLSKRATVVYRTTTAYVPNAEGVIAWNDPSIGIDWPFDSLKDMKEGAIPILSFRDKQAEFLTTDANQKKTEL